MPRPPRSSSRTGAPRPPRSSGKSDAPRPPRSSGNTDSPRPSRSSGNNDAPRPARSAGNGDAPRPSRSSGNAAAPRPAGPPKRQRSTGGAGGRAGGGGAPRGAGSRSGAGVEVWPPPAREAPVAHGWANERDEDGDGPFAKRAAPAAKLTHPDGAASRRASKAPTAEVLANRWSPDLGILPDVVAEYVRAWLMPERVRGDRREVNLIDVHANAVRELSLAFTAERRELAAGYLSQPRYRAAYLLYYVLTGAASVQTALHLSGWQPPRREPGQPLRVLDLGAGPLTASLGVAQLLSALGLGAGKQALQVTAVDGVASALQDGKALLQIVRPDAMVMTADGNLRERRSLSKAVRGQYDLIILANVLNEWGLAGKKSSDAAAFVQWLREEHLSEDGTMLLLEPATRVGSHVLIDVREALLALGHTRVLAPCMGTGPCPYAERGHRDWCFSDQPWRRPELIVRLDNAIGHERGTLKFSYLLLAPGEPAEAKRSQSVLRARVIGGPMKAGGTYRRYLCGPEGRVTAVVPDGQRVPDGLLYTFRGDRTEVVGQPNTAPRGRRVEAELHLLPERPVMQQPTEFQRPERRWQPERPNRRR